MYSQSKLSMNVNPMPITYTQWSGPSCALSQSPQIIPQLSAIFKITVGGATTENILNLVDQNEYLAVPEPIQPILVTPGPGGKKESHKYQSSSSESDDYAYIQGEF